MRSFRSRGRSVQMAVFRSVYTEDEREASGAGDGDGARGSVTYLDDEEARKAEANKPTTIGRAWELWKQKAVGK